MTTETTEAGLGNYQGISSPDAILQDLRPRVEALEGKVPGDNLAIGVLSGNLDSTMAAFIIALGAAAYDMQVDLFFTFWAIAALRDPKKKRQEGPARQDVRLDAAGRVRGSFRSRRCRWAASGRR